MENEPFERWHGAHHYSNKVHLLLVIFLFMTALVLIGSYFALNNSRFASKLNPTPTIVQTTQVPTISPNLTEQQLKPSE